MPPHDPAPLVCEHNPNNICLPCLRDLTELRHKLARTEREADHVASQRYAQNYAVALRRGREAIRSGKPLTDISNVACPAGPGDDKGITRNLSDHGHGLPPTPGLGFVDELGRVRGLEELNFDNPRRIGNRFGGNPYDEAITPTRAARRGFR